MKKIFVFVLLLVLTASATAADFTSQINQVDKAIDSSYARAKMVGNPLTDDSTFVRRAYLTLAGRIPTLTEYEQFTKSTAADKRKQLTFFLTRSAGYTSNMYNFWSDQLRTRERINNTNNVNGILYIDYLKKQIATNVPYDKFVYDLLTSTGSYYQVPSTGYLLRDLGMPLDNLIATSRVFMGIDIGCAQCHDDPFQNWSQMQFYQFAAMFHGAEANGRRNPTIDARDNAKRLRDQVEAIVKSDPTKRGLNNQVNNFVAAVFSGVSIDNTKKLTLPHDYHYKDGKPNQVVEPRVLIGKQKIGNKEDLRVEAAKWITSRDHPTFTKNIVNRLWGAMMGQPIVEDLDNIYASEKLNDPLLAVLEGVMKDVNYSVRDFMFVVANTQAFNRTAYNGPYAGDKYVFIGPKMTRLSAEQMWDSMLAFCTDNPDSFQMSFADKYRQAMVFDNFSEATLPVVQQHIEMLAAANKAKYEGAPNYKGYMLIRASELNDTNASVTMLQQLGRSDRELIATSSREGSVTQVISLVNGAMADIATAKTSAIMKTIDKMSPTDKVDAAFKAVLSRKATIDEKATFAGVSDDDLVWSLLNVNEFRFTK